jgi:protein SCO1/2
MQAFASSDHGAGLEADHKMDHGGASAMKMEPRHETHSDHSAHDTHGQEAMADHGGHDHEAMMKAAEAVESMPDGQGDANLVRVEERLGEYIDFSAKFVDSQNRPVDLRAVFDKPVVLLPVYFMCPSVCTFLQAGLAKALNGTDEIPGKDFNVITLSFSDDEDHTHARGAKYNYSKMVKREMEPDNWYHLTGDRENILKLTRSLGYYFVKKEPYIYIHPSALVVLAGDGKIIRYLYGQDFLPFDLGMALNEARRGEPGLSIKRGVLSFCFDYDPENKTYVFKMFRITGTAILTLLAGFLLFLIRPARSGGSASAGKKSKKRRGLQHGPPDS